MKMNSANDPMLTDDDLTNLEHASPLLDPILASLMNDVDMK